MHNNFPILRTPNGIFYIEAVSHEVGNIMGDYWMGDNNTPRFFQTHTTQLMRARARYEMMSDSFLYNGTCTAPQDYIASMMTRFARQCIEPAIASANFYDYIGIMKLFTPRNLRVVSMDVSREPRIETVTCGGYGFRHPYEPERIRGDVEFVTEITNEVLGPQYTSHVSMKRMSFITGVETT